MNMLAKLAAQVADLERRLAGVTRYGTVAQVDAAGGTVRIDLGDGMLSGPIPYAQTAGDVKVHTPPSVGQQMVIHSPGGDMRQGYAMPLAFSTANTSPSTKADEHVLAFGDILVTLKGDSLTIDAGGGVLVINATGVTVTGNFAAAGGTFKHDGKNVGKDHKHSGVQSGGSSTGAPV